MKYSKERLLKAILRHISIDGFTFDCGHEHIATLNFKVSVWKGIDSQEGVWVKEKTQEEDFDILSDIYKKISEGKKIL